MWNAISLVQDLESPCPFPTTITITHFLQGLKVNHKQPNPKFGLGCPISFLVMITIMISELVCMTKWFHPYRPENIKVTLSISVSCLFSEKKKKSFQLNDILNNIQCRKNACSNRKGRAVMNSSLLKKINKNLIQPKLYIDNRKKIDQCNSFTKYKYPIWKITFTLSPINKFGTLEYSDCTSAEE